MPRHFPHQAKPFPDFLKNQYVWSPGGHAGAHRKCSGGVWGNGEFLRGTWEGSGASWSSLKGPQENVFWLDLGSISIGIINISISYILLHRIPIYTTINVLRVRPPRTFPFPWGPPEHLWAPPGPPGTSHKKAKKMSCSPRLDPTRNHYKLKCKEERVGA